QYGVLFADEIMLKKNCIRLFTLQAPFTPGKNIDTNRVSLTTFRPSKSGPASADPSTLLSVKKSKLKKYLHVIEKIDISKIKTNAYETLFFPVTACALLVKNVNIQRSNLAVSVRDYDSESVVMKVCDTFYTAGHAVKAAVPESLCVVLNLIERKQCPSKVAIVNTRGRKCVLSFFTIQDKEIINNKDSSKDTDAGKDTDSSKVTDVNNASDVNKANDASSDVNKIPTIDETTNTATSNSDATDKNTNTNNATSSTIINTVTCTNRILLGPGENEINRVILNWIQRLVLKKFNKKPKFTDHRVIFYPMVVNEEDYENDSLMSNYIFKNENLEIKNDLQEEIKNDLKKSFDKDLLGANGEDFMKMFENYKDGSKGAGFMDEFLKNMKQGKEDFKKNEEDAKNEDENKGENKVEDINKDESNEVDKSKEDKNEEDKKIEDEKVDENEKFENLFEDEKILYCDVSSVFKKCKDSLKLKKRIEDELTLEFRDKNHKSQTALLNMEFEKSELEKELDKFYKDIKTNMLENTEDVNESFNTEERQQQINAKNIDGYTYILIGDLYKKEYLPYKFTNIIFTDETIVSGASRILDMELLINDTQFIKPIINNEYKLNYKEMVNEINLNESIEKLGTEIKLWEEEHEKNLKKMESKKIDKKITNKHLFTYINTDEIKTFINEYKEIKNNSDKKKILERFDVLRNEDKKIRIDTERRGEGVNKLESIIKRFNNELENMEENNKKIFEEVKIWFETNKENMNLLYSAFLEKYLLLDSTLQEYINKKEAEKKKQEEANKKE
ncbi:hypothetical protein COBT_003231, partial [Conglomerata obtusa]